MTPKDFANAYRRIAIEVSAGTGIDTVVLLGQWANETAWGTVVVGNNLANIRCSPKTFCRYASLDDFATDCIATWHNGNYAAVLAAPNAPAQLDAVVKSPWSAGHYGGNLHPFYDPLEAYEMTPEEHGWLELTKNQVYDAAQRVYAITQLDAGAVVTLHDSSQETIGVTLKSLKAQIAAISPAAVDFKPVLDAITTNDADVDATLTNLSNAIKNLTLKAV